MIQIKVQQAMIFYHLNLFVKICASKQSISLVKWLIYHLYLINKFYLILDDRNNTTNICNNYMENRSLINCLNDLIVLYDQFAELENGIGKAKSQIKKMI